MDEPEEKNSNSTYSFFFKNLSVTGFYEENCLFMTVKELFDNSIDALCNKKGDESIEEEGKGIREKKIEIEIKEYGSNSSFYEIICRDNGEGIEVKDLENISEMFLTSKEKCITSGKFGIGLKTILLYSFKTAYGFLHIKIKVKNNKIWDFILVLDKNLNHTFVQNFKEYIDDKWEWTIEISVILKINNNYICDKKIHSYIKLFLLWKKNITVKYIHNPNGEQFIYTYSSYSDTSEENILSMLADNSINMIFKKDFITSYNYDVNMYVNVRKSEKIIPYEHGHNIGFLFLIRYVNSMPLLRSSSSDCSITVDFRNFLKYYGPQFGIELPTAENRDEMTLEELAIPNCFDELSKVANIFPVNRSEKSTWNIMIIGIDVRGRDISFVSLSKNCIKEGEYLSSLIKKCSVNLYNNIKRELPQEFENISDYQLRQALDIYGVQLASSLSKIILKGHEEFKNKIFFLLNEKKKNDNNTCEKEEYNSTFTNYDENILTKELYTHIREKIMLNEKAYENPKAKNQLTDDSNKSYYKNDPSKDDSYSDDDGEYK
ncbi:hypothetical protein YYG_01567 [Plasmodium vinckei petteri]|uniref:Uncharacterized protein n=2 Tax=Plasmodium TaxID=5820 RepID=W7B6F5_PLAVN|nr:hypothetical protein YYG_01567 [Plasmodium vinckei petteri]CAD2109023.1 conserved Plasmodium protein, unknown function [Plasmodium vinckei petteri]